MVELLATLSYRVSIRNAHQELRDLWLQHSRDVSWQSLFLAFGLQNELPPASSQIATAQCERILRDKDGPQTPPKRKDSGAADPAHSQNLHVISPVKTSIFPKIPKRVDAARPMPFGQPPKPDTKFRCPPTSMEKVEQDEKGSDAKTAKRKAAENEEGLDFESDESKEYGW